ncbi:hypothetical protein Tco_1379464 [Tanacetum coccineum]
MECLFRSSLIAMAGSCLNSGIRRIEDFNIALMATYIWSILTHRESIWVKWLHTYKLKGCSFWDVPCRAWFDRWADVCPIKDLLSNRDITRSGFSLDDSVSNLISDGVWRWPIDWLSRFPILAHLHVPLLLDDWMMLFYGGIGMVFCGLFQWLVFGIQLELGLIL